MPERHALVTGISRGIGKAICIELLNAGYSVHGVYNQSHDEATELAARHPRLILHRADLADRGAVLKLTSLLKGERFSALVNNAGIIEFEDFSHYDYAIWDRTLSVNVTAPLLLCTALQSNIHEGGAIVNIASTDGLIGSFSSMAYAASKAALMNLTKSLANNFGARGIRVNAVAPGWINTGMSTEPSLEAAKLTPLGRNGTPEDVARVVVWLLSDTSNFVTGATLNVDGGYTNVDYIMRREAGL